MQSHSAAACIKNFRLSLSWSGSIQLSHQTAITILENQWMLYFITYPILTSAEISETQNRFYVYKLQKPK